jgi:hypothetical protein
MWRLRFVIVPYYSLRFGFRPGQSQEPSGTVAATEERPAPNAKRRTPIFHAPCLRTVSPLQSAAMFHWFVLPMRFVTQSLFVGNEDTTKPQSRPSSLSNAKAC